MIRQKKMAGNAEYAYFDYGLVAVLIFLICFGLIMLYSTSYYLLRLTIRGTVPFISDDSFCLVGGACWSCM